MHRTAAPPPGRTQSQSQPQLRARGQLKPATGTQRSRVAQPPSQRQAATVYRPFAGEAAARAAAAAQRHEWQRQQQLRASLEHCYEPLHRGEEEEFRQWQLEQQARHEYERHAAAAAAHLTAPLAAAPAAPPHSHTAVESKVEGDLRTPLQVAFVPPGGNVPTMPPGSPPWNGAPAGPSSSSPIQLDQLRDMQRAIYPAQFFISYGYPPHLQPQRQQQQQQQPLPPQQSQQQQQPLQQAPLQHQPLQPPPHSQQHDISQSQSQSPAAVQPIEHSQLGPDSTQLTQSHGQAVPRQIPTEQQQKGQQGQSMMSVVPAASHAHSSAMSGLSQSAALSAGVAAELSPATRRSPLPRSDSSGSGGSTPRFRPAATLQLPSRSRTPVSTVVSPEGKSVPTAVMQLPTLAAVKPASSVPSVLATAAPADAAVAAPALTGATAANPIESSATHSSASQQVHSSALSFVQSILGASNPASRRASIVQQQQAAPPPPPPAAQGQAQASSLGQSGPISSALAALSHTLRHVNDLAHQLGHVDHTSLRREVDALVDAEVPGEDERTRRLETARHQTLGQRDEWRVQPPQLGQLRVSPPSQPVSQAPSLMSPVRPLDAYITAPPPPPSRHAALPATLDAPSDPSEPRVHPSEVLPAVAPTKARAPAQTEARAAAHAPSDRELNAMFFGSDSDEDEEETEEGARSDAASTASVSTRVAHEGAAQVQSGKAAPASSTSPSASAPRTATPLSVDASASAALQTVVREVSPSPHAILDRLEKSLLGTIRSIEFSDAMVAEMFPAGAHPQHEEEEDALELSRLTEEGDDDSVHGDDSPLDAAHDPAPVFADAGEERVHQRREQHAIHHPSSPPRGQQQQQRIVAPAPRTSPPRQSHAAILDLRLAATEEHEDHLTQVVQSGGAGSSGGGGARFGHDASADSDEPLLHRFISAGPPHNGHVGNSSGDGTEHAGYDHSASESVSSTAPPAVHDFAGGQGWEQHHPYPHAAHHDPHAQYYHSHHPHGPLAVQGAQPTFEHWHGNASSSDGYPGHAFPHEYQHQHQHQHQYQQQHQTEISSVEPSIAALFAKMQQQEAELEALQRSYSELKKHDAVAQLPRHHEHEHAHKQAQEYEREYGYGQQQSRSMAPERGYGGTAGGSSSSVGVEVDASPVDEWPQMEEEEEEEYETGERSHRHHDHQRPGSSALQREEGAMLPDRESSLAAPNWEHTAPSRLSSSTALATGAGAGTAAGSTSHSPPGRSFRARHEPLSFQAMPPNSEPSSEFSFDDDDDGGEESDTVSMDSLGSSHASSSRASGPQPRRHSHRRMESAEVMEEFERTIHVRGLDHDEKTLERELSDDAYLAAEVAARKGAMHQPRQSPTDRWDDLPSLHAAARPSSVISLATRSTSQPALLYLDKVQRDGTTVRLCIHQRDNSLLLATLYLRCLQLPTTEEYARPLSKLIQRKIRAFVANVQREREDKAALLRSLQRKADANRDPSPREAEVAPTPRARGNNYLKQHATVRFSPQLPHAKSVSSASLPPAMRLSHPLSSRPPPLSTPRIRNGTATPSSASSGSAQPRARSRSRPRSGRATGATSLNY